jgi:hypothetical protein
VSKCAGHRWEAKEILILHTRTELKKSAIGDCNSLAGLPLVEYGTPLEPCKKAIRHLSINRISVQGELF